MTQNQISFFKAKEDQRHDVAMEAIGKEQNKINKQHLTKQDQYTQEHYERSDTSGFISANASAMNAQAAATNAATNRKKYEMEYDIEYNWTQQPLIAQWYDPEHPETHIPQDGSQGVLVYNYPKGMPLSAQIKDSQAMQELYNAVYKPKEKEAELAQSTAKTLQSGSGAVLNVFNALYGKQGLVGILDNIISE